MESNKKEGVCATSPKKEEIWHEPDYPHALRCSKCGTLFPPSFSECPGCGAKYDWGSGERIYQNPSETAFGYVSKTGSNIQTFSGTLSTTITSLEKIPIPQRKEFELESLIDDLTNFRSQVDIYEKRLQKIERNFSYKIDKFDELKEKLELKIPEGVWKSLPLEIQKNIELVRKLYFQGTPEACSPFLRKTLTVAIVIRFKMDKKEDKIYNEDKQLYDLPKLLEISKQEGYITNYLCTQLLRIKIFGDIGIHDYRIDLKEEDVIPLFELLRLALESLYKEKSY